MSLKPVALNTAIAWLFVVGSACFAVGSLAPYADAVGGTGDDLTFFVGSIFFTAASFAQLVQAQTPAVSEVDEVTQHVRAPVCFTAWLPHDRNWLAAVTQFAGTLFFNISTLFALVGNLTVQGENRHVWRPDLFGSTLFLVASACGILAVEGRFFGMHPRSPPWVIAWLNMVGSVLFMAAALAGYVLPATGDLLDESVAVTGTLLGAVCFLIGAILLFPAWRQAIAKR
jgi:hypothetical protein